MRYRALATLVVLAIAAVFVARSDSSPSTAQVLTASITLSSAQILSLHDAPVQIVAAPGAGKVIRPISGMLSLKANTIPYTSSTGYIAFDYPGYNGFDRVPLGVGQDDLFSGGDVVALTDGESSWSVPASAAINAPLVVSATRGNPTGGNGTLFAQVNYVVVAVP